MKRIGTITAALLLVAAFAIPAAAQGTGYYEWTISTSNSDPFANEAATAPTFLYLWLNQACNSATAQPGMAACEFDINTQGAITVLAFTAQSPFLNAGGSTNLLMAVGGCPVGPLVAGQFIVSQSGDGAMGIVPSAANGNNGTVDCGANPSLWSWPEFQRCVGFATTGYTGERQDHGNGCTANAVEDASWGSLKALYR